MMRTIWAMEGALCILMVLVKVCSICNDANAQPGEHGGWCGFRLEAWGAASTPRAAVPAKGGCAGPFLKGCQSKRV